jgi:mono/diheme cytochrome c family protein
MKLVLKVLKVFGGLLIILVLAVAAIYVWASAKTSSLLDRTIETHTVDSAIPAPLSEAERTELGLTEEDARGVALQRAVARGEHLIEARYGCIDCHGGDLSGGVMMDAMPVARLFGPNLTTGQGSRTTGYGPADWDRIVRHGVRADGRPATMPSGDFQRMSDQELSDIVSYVRSLPAVDNTMPPVVLGRLGKVLVATGQLPFSADLIESHRAEHPAVPPAAEVSVEFGEHLAGVCTGCHGPNLAGGPIAGGDPSWPPARNLTPHEQGLGPWSYEQFVTAMREARRPDGSQLREPMAAMVPAARRMTEVELEALWIYLRSLAPLPNR